MGVKIPLSLSQGVSLSFRPPGAGYLLLTLTSSLRRQ